jgi:hypothetical protein
MIPYDRVHRFVLFQRFSILKDFRDEMTTCLIATTQERLLLHAIQYRWAVAGLKQIRPSSALVVTKQNSEPELWVRHSYRGYRRAFLRYLSAYYGIASTSISRDWQIDHLHPAARFLPNHEHYFVRLALIEQNVNSSYGAGFERLLCERERARELTGGIHMDWMAFLKVRGVTLPRKMRGMESWQIWAWRLAKELAAERLDPILTYVGLTTMLNLAYLGIWKALSLHPSFEAEALAFDACNCAPQLLET